ncbi:MAG: hypothetical protein ACLR6T_00155 [Intestinibacter sp.]
MPEANVTSVAELEHALQTNLEVINLLKETIINMNRPCNCSR